MHYVYILWSYPNVDPKLDTKKIPTSSQTPSQVVIGYRARDACCRMTVMYISELKKFLKRIRWWRIVIFLAVVGSMRAVGDGAKKAVK